MRKFTLIFLILLCALFPASLPAAETESEQGAAISEREKTLDEKLSLIREAKEEADRTETVIEREKGAVEREKERLERSVDKSPQSGEVAGEQTAEIAARLEIVEEAKAFLERKAVISREQQMIFEEVKKYLARAVEIFSDRDVSIRRILREIRLVEAEVREVDQVLAGLDRDIYKREREITILKRDISTRALLMGLRENRKENKLFEIEQVAREERIAEIVEEVEIFSKHRELNQLKRELFDNYENELKNEQWARIRFMIMTQGPGRESESRWIWILSFASVLLLFFLLRGFMDRLMERSPALMRDVWGFAIRRILPAGFLILAVLVGARLMRFHGFVDYAHSRLILTLVCVLATVVVFKLISEGLIQMIGRLTKADREIIRGQGRVYYWGRNGLIWAAICVALFFVLEIWNLGSHGSELVWEWMQHPLLQIGGGVLSAWVFIKVGLIVWAFFVGAGVAERFLRLNVLKNTRLEESVQYTLAVTLKYVIQVAGILIGLRVLGLDMATMTVFAGTIGIGIGLGLQEIVKNFLSGIVLLAERPVKVGDYIQVGDLPGRVQAIKVRSTVVDTFDNISVIVPNADFISQRIINWSYSDRVIRVQVPVGVAYGSDTKLVEATLLEVARNHPKVLKRPEPSVWFEEFGDSSLNFKLLAWIREPQNRMIIVSELNFKADQAFREKGITIPFPQRDLHIKSSDVKF